MRDTVNCNGKFNFLTRYRRFAEAGTRKLGHDRAIIPVNGSDKLSKVNYVIYLFIFFYYLLYIYCAKIE